MLNLQEGCTTENERERTEIKSERGKEGNSNVRQLQVSQQQQQVCRQQQQQVCRQQQQQVCRLQQQQVCRQQQQQQVCRLQQQQVCRLQQQQVCRLQQQQVCRLQQQQVCRLQQQQMHRLQVSLQQLQVCLYILRISVCIFLVTTRGRRLLLCKTFRLKNNFQQLANQVR
ncbi:Hypothetical predicted protein [Scomber scombrus]|uniref:Uncharacterized protein n=1 Tax=Scomber scombrus TaxID=13677 RepID=A0AAV1Q8L0_SCOSC